MCIFMGDVTPSLSKPNVALKFFNRYGSVAWKNRSRTFNRRYHLSSSTSERGGSRLGKISLSFDHCCVEVDPKLPEELGSDLHGTNETEGWLILSDGEQDSESLPHVGEWLKPKKARNIDHGSLAGARSEEPRSPDMKKLDGEGTWKTPTSTLGSALDSPKVPSALLLGPAPGLV